MHESDFQKELVEGLRSRGVSVIELNGTFDLIIEGDRPYIAEVKMVKHSLRGFPEPSLRGIQLTENETREILRMKFPPFILVYDEDRDQYYFLDEEWVGDVVRDLSEFSSAIIINDEDFYPFPNCCTFNELIVMVVRKVSEEYYVKEKG